MTIIIIIIIIIIIHGVGVGCSLQYIACSQLLFPWAPPLSFPHVTGHSLPRSRLCNIHPRRQISSLIKHHDHTGVLCERCQSHWLQHNKCSATATTAAIITSSKSTSTTLNQASGSWCDKEERFAGSDKNSCLLFDLGYWFIMFFCEWYHLILVGQSGPATNLV